METDCNSKETLKTDEIEIITIEDEQNDTQNDEIESTESASKGNQQNPEMTEDLPSTEVEEPIELDDILPKDQMEDPVFDEDDVGKEVFKGFPSEEEFKGFPFEEQLDFCNKIDQKSLSLFTILSTLSNSHQRKLVERLSVLSSPICIRRKRRYGRLPKQVVVDKIIVPMENEDPQVYILGLEKLASEQERIEFLVNENASYQRLAPLKKSPNRSTISHKLFPDHQSQLLRRPLELGWSREVILYDVQEGSTPLPLDGCVTYISPSAELVTSTTQLSEALMNYPDGTLSRANFSFIPYVIGNVDNEAVHKIDKEGCKTPQRDNRRRRMQDFDMSPDITEGPLAMKLMQHRRKIKQSLQHGSKNAVAECMKINDSEGGLFGLSALSETLASLDHVDAERQLKEYTDMVKQYSMSEEASEGKVKERVTQSNGSSNILPCSIRCPGLAGVIPQLQCHRCLCLYHSQCLGISEDREDMANFLCPNCEVNEGGESSGVHQTVYSSDTGHENASSISPLKRKMCGSTTLPPLSSNIFGKGITVKRVDPSGIRNNHGLLLPRRFTKMRQKPTHSSHNLTITPLVAKRSVPRVPNLSPINQSSAALRSPSHSIPVYKRGSPGGNPTIVDSIQVNPDRGGNLSKPPSGFQHLICSPVATTSALSPSKKVPAFGDSFKPHKKPTFNLFRNYAQSIVEIGGKKYIAMLGTDSKSNN